MGALSHFIGSLSPCCGVRRAGKQDGFPITSLPGCPMLLGIRWRSGQLQGSSMPLPPSASQPVRPLFSKWQKKRRGAIFVNDQMPHASDHRGPGLTSERCLILRDLAEFHPEGTTQVSQPPTLPAVRDSKSEINRGEVKGLARAV